MKAVGYKVCLPISNPESLVDIELPRPHPTQRDLLVEVKAISVNPADTKARMSLRPAAGEYQVLGYDAAGVVVEVGREATLFKCGDEVFYAGSIARPGTNSAFHLVDERIVGRKPRSLDFSHATALPLTSITAWELLFDRLGVKVGKPLDVGNILVIGGAGGVGSILIQLAKKLTGLTIIATASRPESREWCLEMGADHVVDHRKPFGEQLRSIGISAVEYIACLTGSDTHYPAIVGVLAPQGKVGIIDDPSHLDATPLKQKCASLHWEFMFARSLFGTHDIVAQHRLLNEVSELIDAGLLRTTVGEDFGSINAAHLKKAHALLESGRAKGKIVLTGF